MINGDLEKPLVQILSQTTTLTIIDQQFNSDTTHTLIGSDWDNNIFVVGPVVS